jgi:hypothetical protein
MKCVTLSGERASAPVGRTGRPGSEAMLTLSTNGRQRHRYAATIGNRVRVLAEA